MPLEQPTAACTCFGWILTHPVRGERYQLPVRQCIFEYTGQVVGPGLARRDHQQPLLLQGALHERVDVVARVAQLAQAARRADVVYSTGMVGRSALGTALARKPIVQKLTSDPTYERSVRYGLYGGALDTFQHAGGVRVRALRRARNVALRRARRIVIPSESLRDLAV
jgi:hypothetical protein